MKNNLNPLFTLFLLLAMLAGCTPTSVVSNQSAGPKRTCQHDHLLTRRSPTRLSAHPLPSIGLQSLPNTGQEISPLAVSGSTFEGLNPGLVDNPTWLAGQAVSSVVSPDKKTLLVLTSGYNRIYRTNGVPDAFGSYFNWPDSQEYVFVYDISTDTPVKKQVLPVPNTYNGIVFDPSGMAFYVSSGMGNFPYDNTGAINPAKAVGDNVHIFTLGLTGTWIAQSGPAFESHRRYRTGCRATHRRTGSGQ